MAEPFLIGEAMTGGYGGADILHACTISVEKGQIAVIVGPNGAGKSTAMKAVFGMLKLRSGHVKLAGEDITALSEIDGSHQTEVEPVQGEAHTKGRLSTIPEGTHETEPSEDGHSNVGSYLQHADGDLQESLDRVSDLLELPLPEELKRET
jgi:ABC-type sugar transport system ATPase subunit